MPIAVTATHGMPTAMTALHMLACHATAVTALHMLACHATAVTALHMFACRVPAAVLNVMLASLGGSWAGSWVTCDSLWVL